MQNFFLYRSNDTCYKKLLVRHVNSFMSVDNLWQQLRFICRRLNFERKENRVDVRALLYYAFKVQLNQDYCFQQLQLAYKNEALIHSIVFRWFTEFRKGSNSLLYGEHTEKPL